MSWQTKAKQILENSPTLDPKKPKEVPPTPLYSVYSVPTQPLIPSSVAELLEANQSARYAVVADASSDPVIITVAERGGGYKEIRVPSAQYDPFALLALVERWGAVVH